MRPALIIGTALASAVLLLGGCADGDDASPTEPGPPPPVPRTLADGTTPAPMPDAVRRFRGRRVIATKELPGQAAELLCPPAREFEDRGTPAGAWLSADGLSVGYLIADTSQLHSCDAVWVDGRWEKCASTVLEAQSVEEVTAEETPSICSDAEPPRGFTWVAVAPGAAWALVDHRSYWAAYLAVNRPLLRISATEGVDPGESFRATVVFVDDRGRQVEERTIDRSV